MQNQNIVPDFSVYFDVKPLSFPKINPLEISKPLYSRKLVQAKIFRHKCSDAMKKLVCNKMSSSCSANHSVKNVSLFFNSELKESCKKKDAGNNLSNDVT